MASCRSSIIRKMIMAVGGFVWMGFIFGHMAGNLLILFSPEAYNQYGHAIVSNKVLLYGTEAALIGALLAHVVLGLWLTYENKKASRMGMVPKKYAVAPSAKKKPRFASSTMAFQGTALLAFIILHLRTFKYADHYEVTYDGVTMHDLHRLVLEVFQDPAYVGWYVICLILLGFHLSHGFWSFFQTIGFNHPKYNCTIKKIGFIYSVVVAGGFLSLPLYVFLLA